MKKKREKFLGIGVVSEDEFVEGAVIENGVDDSVEMANVTEYYINEHKERQSHKMGKINLFDIAKKKTEKAMARELRQQIKAINYKGPVYISESIKEYLEQIAV